MGTPEDLSSLSDEGVLSLSEGIMKCLAIVCLLAVGASAAPNFRGVIGHSGIVRPDGNNVQFTHAQAENFLLVGASGMITKDGYPIQFTRPGVTILLEGPSAYVMSDGTLVQKRAKRSAVTYGNIVGHSGLITNT